jgi:hypothetical protein
MSKKIAVSLLAMLVFAFAPGLVQAASMVPIYQDAFGRAGNLNGSSPSPVDMTGGTYTASSSFTTNGTNNAVASSNGDAYLPVTLGNHVYTLSETITPNTNGTDTSDWLALGFTGANGLGNGYLAGPTEGNAQLWLIYRENGGTSTFYNGGTNNAVSSANNATPGTPDTFTITLNGGTGAFSISDSLGLLPTDTGTLSTGSLAAINGIGFSAYSSASGEFSNLSLEVTVPEPASLMALVGLASMGLVGLALRRHPG